MNAAKLIALLGGQGELGWDPAFNATNVAYSAGNTVATSSAISINVRSAAFAPAGSKIYFEITSNNFTTPNTQGVCNQNLVTTEGVPGASGNAIGWWVGADLNNPGHLYSGNGSNLNVAVGLWTAGSNLQFAIDDGAGLIWVRYDSNSWNNNGSANPATGVGGVTMPNTTNFPRTRLYAAGWIPNSTQTVTVRTVPSSFLGAPPSGFTALGLF